MEEEFEVTRAREVVQYRESSDPKVANAGIEVGTDRKWKAEKAVQAAEEIKILQISGNEAAGSLD